MTSPFRAYMAQRTDANPLAEAAATMGVPVFACDSQKRPVTPNGFKDATTDPEAVRSQFTRPGAAFIGMPTGEVSGVVVVDVDIKEHRQGGAWLDANSHRMPQTRTIRTGSGGLHIYLAHPGQRVKNSNDRIAPGIDVRGDGGYVIVPPSPGYAVADDAPLADIPDWLLPILCPPEPAHQPAPPPRHRYEDGGTPYGMAALDDECTAIMSAPFGQQEHTLNSASLKIGALVAGGELHESAALSALLSAARGIPSQPGKPRWNVAEIERKVRRAFRDGMNSPRQAPEPHIPEETHPAAALIAKLTAQVYKQAAKPLPVPSDLMDVGGIIGEFVAHCDATAFSRQPFLALGAGICAVGALAGRRYATQTDLRTNFYGVGIADSGGGKDHARSMIKRIFLSTPELAPYLGGNKIASGAGMLKAIEGHPSILFQLDEFGLWLQNITNKQAGSHLREIWALMTELYTSANTPYGGTEYANRKENARVIIQAPNLCMWGTTVPNEFWQAMKTGALQNGSMARFLVFLSPENYPDTPFPMHVEPPQSLVDGFRAIAAGVPGHDYGGNLASHLTAATPMVPYRVPEAPGAREALLTIRADELAWKREAEGTWATSLIARFLENAYKLALVRAISRDPFGPTIGAGDVEWGRVLARHCIDTLMRDAERNVADNEFEARANKALDIIRRSEGATRRELWRKGLRLSRKDTSAVLDTLLEAGLITRGETTPKVGRPTERYIISSI